MSASVPIDRALESQYYLQLYAIADADKDGKVSGGEGASFLRRSGLSNQALERVWDISDSSQRGYLTHKEFGVAMRLVAAAQQGKPIAMDQVQSAPTTLARFSDIPYPVPSSNQTPQYAPQQQYNQPAQYATQQVPQAQPQYPTAQQQQYQQPTSFPQPSQPTASYAPQATTYAAPVQYQTQPASFQPATGPSQPPAQPYQQPASYTAQTYSQPQQYPQAQTAPSFPAPQYAQPQPAYTQANYQPQTYPAPQVQNQRAPYVPQPQQYPAQSQPAQQFVSPQVTYAAQPQAQFAAQQPQQVSPQRTTPYATQSPPYATYAQPPTQIQQQVQPQPVTQPVYQPVAQPVYQPVAQPVVQPVAQPVVQPVAQPVAQPVVHEIPQPIQQHIHQQVQQYVQQTTQPAAVEAYPTSFTEQELYKFDNLFVQADVNKDGYVDGNEAKTYFTKGKLSSQQLANIWNLAEMDKDSKLNLGEFRIAMHLIYWVMKHQSIPVTLPPALIAQAFSAPSSASNPATSQPQPQFVGVTPEAAAQAFPTTSQGFVPTNQINYDQTKHVAQYALPGASFETRANLSNELNDALNRRRNQ